MAPSSSRDPTAASPNSSSFLSSTSNQVTAGSVRRNLFSAHLSRRPASGVQPQSQSNSQARRHDSQSQIQGQQYGSSLPRLRGHQRSVSTPSLSPSPPRSSPFHDPPNNGTSSTFIPPPIPQLSPPHRTALADGYDPTISPHRPISPRSSAALFPNQSIIALNPLTGRPVLPKLPILPGRLRLSDSDDGHEGDHAEDAEDEEVAQEEAGTQERELSDVELHDPSAQAYARHPRRRRARRHDPYDHHTSHIATADHAHAAAMAAAAASAEAEAEAEADEERRDRQRIERLLREMMARQRARAKGKIAKVSKVSPSPSSEEDEEAEQDELMGLIMGSLRREVARADVEAWMFGEPLGVGGIAGRDEVAVYD
ncbi:uncharacterized protein Z519_00095 [Cladophialophora bantiana CBS 173.52]|uniref:Uncharacterized protein n=1 Tax=Cladophialophora bantiana (strain ATCC 10958 / CBS 173.52 / CDC B-1940 / NIH 8579) TaxID=1442370 RepID=A0A0D2I586_CLAB1|nr:uncharacterized protein Z519_00095 [Cladophialophora bantiana CBS 173.52]KIW98435.1 hypothetical protein Z519_00095 [Cladophialophora bantiana CBS 173.52]